MSVRVSCLPRVFGVRARARVRARVRVRVRVRGQGQVRVRVRVRVRVSCLPRVPRGTMLSPGSTRHGSHRRC